MITIQLTQDQLLFLKEALKAININTNDIQTYQSIMMKLEKSSENNNMTKSHFLEIIKTNV